MLIFGFHKFWWILAVVLIQSAVQTKPLKLMTTEQSKQAIPTDTWPEISPALLLSGETYRKFWLPSALKQEPPVIPWNPSPDNKLYWWLLLLYCRAMQLADNAFGSTFLIHCCSLWQTAMNPQSSTVVNLVISIWFRWIPKEAQYGSTAELRGTTYS